MELYERIRRDHREEGLSVRGLASRHQVHRRAVRQAKGVGIWAVGGRGCFWPGWVLFGWGIGIMFHAWNTFFSRPIISDADIDREIRKLQGRH